MLSWGKHPRSLQIRGAMEGDPVLGLDEHILVKFLGDEKNQGSSSLVPFDVFLFVCILVFVFGLSFKSHGI